MDAQTAASLRKSLDATLMQLTELIKQDLYHNIIVATVRDWFEGNDSIRTLNEKIRQHVEARWPFLEAQVRRRLADFEAETQATLADSKAVHSPALDVQAIAEGVSQSISVILSTLGTALIAMICGGTGTALIATGPVGLIIGAVIGALAFFLGKTSLEAAIGWLIVDLKIPALLKTTAKGKVATQLKLQESAFEENVYTLLSEQFQPLYEVIDHGLRQSV